MVTLVESFHSYELECFRKHYFPYICVAEAARADPFQCTFALKRNAAQIFALIEGTRPNCLDAVRNGDGSYLGAPETELFNELKCAPRLKRHFLQLAAERESVCANCFHAGRNGHAFDIGTLKPVIANRFNAAWKRHILQCA